jgi:hypothetical protein
MKTETKARKKLDEILEATDMFAYNEGRRTKEGVIDLLIENRTEFIEILKKLENQSEYYDHKADPFDLKNN